MVYLVGEDSEGRGNAESQEGKGHLKPHYDIFVNCLIRE